MKKIICIFGFITILFTVRAQQAAMPTIIVFPADSWMQENHFMDVINDDGESKYVPRYKEALIKSPEMGVVIKSVQKVLADRQFEHQDLKELLNSISEDEASNLANEADGNGVATSAMDALMQQARPDIRVEVQYQVQKSGPRNNISYNITATDAYTAQQVSSVEGSIQMTMDPVDLAMRKAVAGNCDNFCQQLIDYFTDLRNHGRKIAVEFLVAEGANIKLKETEIGEDGDTYDDFLFSWIQQHAVDKSCRKGKSTNNQLTIQNVRIPFFDESGNPLEAETWAKSIRKAFKAETGVKIVKHSKSTYGLGKVGFKIGGE